MSDWPQGENDIAIVGLAGRFPGAPDATAFWDNLCAGTESIRSFSEEELRELGVPAGTVASPGYVGAGAQVDGVDEFDHRFWGYSPREAALMDPQQRLFLQTAWHALEHAGYDPQRHEEPIGVYAGTGLSTYLLFNLVRNPQLSDSDAQMTMLGNDKDFLSTRTSYHLDLRGPSMSVQTGCSTSLVATHLACDALLSYQCDTALAGGVCVVLPERTGYVHFPGSTASSDGHCRAFDADGDGTVFGSGVGVLVLKRLSDALEAGDTVYAVIKGSAVNNDGANRVGFTAPGVDGQAEVIVRALRVAEVDPADVSYVEAHGTATRFGDPVEVAALTRAFRASTDRTGYCALGSVKTNIGHLDAAAGVASLIKTTLALHHGKIPPSLNFQRPNPQLDLAASPFYVNTSLADWKRADGPRYAGVSAFGFGGTNAHLVLAEAPPPTPSEPTRQPQLLVLSAKTDTALATMTGRLADHLRAADDTELADIAFTLQQGRAGLEERAAVVVADRADAIEALGTRLRTAHGARRDRGVAFLFAGLGDQYTGMAEDLYRSEPVFAEAVDRCAELLRPHLGLDIRTVLHPAGERPRAGGATVDLRAMLGMAPVNSELDRTALAHPALFTVEYALARLWLSWGVRPVAMIGHSLGEYVAATIAGVFSLEDALLLIATRARLVDRLPEGAMLAVEMAADKVTELLSGSLTVALINGPELVVVSGAPAEVDRLRERLGELGVEARPLRAGHAFHSALLDPVVEPLAELVSGFQLAAPSTPFVSNATGDWITPAEATDPRYWAEHSVRAVRFDAGLQALCAEGETALVEIGPGQSLCTLAVELLGRKEIADPVVLPSLPSAYDRRRTDTVHLLDVLGRLWLAGVSVDWSGVHGPARRRRVALPGYPFEGRRAWIEAGAVNAAETGRTYADGWLHLPQWRSVPMPPAHTADSLGDGRWLIIGDGAGLAERLADRLRGFGRAVTVAAAGDYRDLADGTAPAHVVHLGNLGDDTGFHDVLDLARALADPAAEHGVRLWVLADGLAGVESTDVLRPDKATLLGAAMCAPQEYEGLNVHCVDLLLDGVADPRLPARLLDLFAEAPVQRLLAYRGIRRWAREFAPLAPAEGENPLRERGVYVITGGLGTIGLDLAEHLARRARARLVLITRSPFPARDRWSDDHGELVAARIRRLRAIEELGGEVLVLSADVTDPARLREAFDAAEHRFGAVHGVIHGAGVVGAPAFGLIADADRERDAKVMDAKVRGTRALHEVLGDRELDFVLLLSSNAAVLGGVGTAAYTAANVHLDAFAQWRWETTGSRWVSVNLEQWLPEDDGAVPVTSFTQYGVTAGEGVAALERVLVGHVAGQVTLMTGDLEARLDRWIRHPEAQRRSVSVAADNRQPRPALDTEYAAPVDPVERTIAEIWQEMLGFDRVGRDDNFYELGGHSLLATQIVTRVRAALGVELSLLSLLGSATVAGFAATVREGDETRDDTPAIRPVPREQRLPLSYAQRRFWFLDHLAPDNPFYNIPDVVRISGPLRTDLLERALNDIVARHEVLRTGFTTVDGEPVQRILPELRVPLPHHDLRELPEAERGARWRLLAAQDAERPFDLARPPLLRATVLRVAEQEHILLLTMHHAVSDGWSIGVFIQELSAGYAAHHAGTDSRFDPLPVQYADFAHWQRERLEAGPERDRLLGYWRDQVADAPPLVDFPTDHPRPPEQSFRGADHPIALPADLVAALRRLGSGENCSLFMTLLTAFTLLLHRYRGDDDLVIGSPIAGRTRSELEPLIGPLVNMVPLRVRVDPGMTTRELLAGCREVTLGAYAHQDLPFELLVEDLRPDRTLSHGQVFQNVLVLQNAPVPSLDMADLRIEQIPTPVTTAKFDLMLQLRETGDGAAGTIEYATDLFTAETVARIGDHFLAILAAMVAGPDRPVGDLPILDAAAYEAITTRLALGPVLPAQEQSLPELFARQAARTPDATAIRCATTDRTWTFAEVDAASNQVAHCLRRHGVGVESLVGLGLRRTPETVSVLIGILKAGAAYVPLDPDYPAERVAFMLADSKVDLLIAEQDTTASCEVVTADRLRAECAAEPETPPALRMDPRSAAYVLYTSGSSGTPKGAVGTHGGMLNRLRWAWREFPFVPGEVQCQKTSLNFLDSFSEIFGSLCAGVPLVVMPTEMLQDPEQLVAALARHGVTRLVLVPSLLRMLLDNVPDLAHRLPRLDLWVCSGEALPVELAERFLTALPGRRLLNLYGASEISADVTHHLVTAADVADGVVPIGRPIAATAVHVLDDRMRPVPLGVEGELYVGGAGLGRGYLGRPDLTAQRFVPNPFAAEPGGVLYATGDRVRLRADGALLYQGRRDNQVKVRGFRVELAEIEAALAGYPELAEAVVLAEGDALVAFCVPRAGEAVDGVAARQFLSDRLPQHMIPTLFVPCPRLPYTPSGKIDRAALRALGRQARPSSAPTVAPRDDAERAVAGIWAEVLGHTGELGVHDDFFSIGGYSLLATRVVVQLRAAFGVELQLRSFFEDATIAGLVRTLRADPVGGAEVERRAAVLCELATLSDDEVERLLSENTTPRGDDQ